MSPRVVQFEYHADSGVRHATSRVDGSRYCVRGKVVKDVLKEYCRLLDHPSRRWQVLKRDSAHLVCNELIEPNADLPITTEIPSYRLRAGSKAPPAYRG